jgi:tetratricopeptide (TPR) repeat protein
VITSRLEKIGNLQKVKIGELSEDDCVLLYKDIRGERNYDDEIVRQIAAKARHLTIVVELLAKTAGEAMLSDSDLLKTLNKQSFDLSEIGEEIDSNEFKATFNEHMSKLYDVSGVGESERAILKKFSLFPPVPLSAEYAKKWFELKNLNPLNKLAGRGWLIKTQDGFYMHHVISDVVKYNKPTFEDCAGLVAAIRRDLDYEVHEIFTTRLPLLPFGESVAEYFDGFEDGALVFLMNRIGWLYIDQGDYNKALYFYEKSLLIAKKVYGEEHENTVAVYSNVALAYYDQGDCEKALEYYGCALEIYEKLNKDHPSFATTYNNMAAVYYNQGDYDEALEYYEYALEIREKVLGKDRPTTATTYNNMGEVYRKQGDYNKALEYHGYALEIREKALGKEHPDTATTYNNMAFVYDNQGDYDKALEWYLKSYRIRLNVLKAEHPYTIGTYNGMKDTFEKSGKDGDFEEWLDEQVGLVVL